MLWEMTALLAPSTTKPPSTVTPVLLVVLHVTVQATVILVPSIQPSSTNAATWIWIFPTSIPYTTPHRLINAIHLHQWLGLLPLLCLVSSSSSSSFVSAAIAVKKGKIDRFHMHAKVSLWCRQGRFWQLRIGRSLITMRSMRNRFARFASTDGMVSSQPVDITSIFRALWSGPRGKVSAHYAGSHWMSSSIRCSVKVVGWCTRV